MRLSAAQSQVKASTNDFGRGKLIRKEGSMEAMLGIEADFPV